MLVIDASYMPGGLSGGVRMDNIGLDQNNIIILMKNCDLIRTVFFEKKNGFGNGERVEDKYGYQSGLKTSLFLEIRIHVFDHKLKVLHTELP